MQKSDTIKIIGRNQSWKKKIYTITLFQYTEGYKNESYLPSEFESRISIFPFLCKKIPILFQFSLWKYNIGHHWSSLLTITKLRVIIMDVEGSRKKKYLANSLPFNSSFPGNDNFIVTDFYLILSGFDQIRGTGGQTRTNHNQGQGK